MKEKIFKLLFPKKASDLEALRVSDIEAERKIWALEQRIKMLSEENDRVRVLLEEKEAKQEPSMADLMRDILYLPMIDFVNIDKDGQPKSPFEGLTKEEQLRKYSRLNDAFNNEMLQEVLDYLENKFGNHAIRHGTEDNRRAAVFSINGIAAVRKQLQTAHDQVVEATDPPEEYDPYAVLSGQ